VSAAGERGKKTCGKKTCGKKTCGKKALSSAGSAPATALIGRLVYPFRESRPTKSGRNAVAASN
jgi:hypothetical protein